jgi:phosphoglycolate phosphatase
VTVRPGAPTVVFDLDGTLVDSLADIIGSFQYGFARFGLTAPDEAQVRALVGQPLEAMYAAFAPADLIPELCAEYRVHYAQNFVTRSRPYPGVPELLATLRGRGYALAVATTKRTPMARSFVEALGLGALLDHVQGTDGFPHKPAPDVIHRALSALGTRGVWMVGDTVTDIQAGRAAGLKTYAVTWGTHSAEQLRAAEPDELRPDLDALLAKLPQVGADG